MPFNARVFRILIASPSDVADERERAVRAIQAWNDQHSAERQVVLLPLRWETHTAPEYGVRPQDAINRQIADHCDLLIGIFWTRLGSPTGVADSGTIEEIERTAKADKPVMLYFSQNKQDPDKIDLEQLSKLREFKKKTLPNALVENFIDAIDFSEKFSRQIDIQLKSILADQQGSDDPGYARPLTDIVLQLAEDNMPVGDELEITVVDFRIENVGDLPDYVSREPKRQRDGTLRAVEGANEEASELFTAAMGGVNKDYYRQLASYIVSKGLYRPLTFWLKNEGAIGARDVYVDLQLKVQEPDKEIVIAPKTSLPESGPSRFGQGGMLFSSSSSLFLPVDEIASNANENWSINFEVPALQPQRQLCRTHDYWIGARESCTVMISARIFADTLSTPISREMKLKIDVQQVDINVNDIVNFADEELAPASGKKNK